MSTRGGAVSFLETGGPGAWRALRGGQWSTESRREAGLLQGRVWGPGPWGQLRGRAARAGARAAAGVMDAQSSGVHSVARLCVACTWQVLSRAPRVRGLRHGTGGVGASSARVGRCCAGRPKVKKKLQRVLWRCQWEEPPSTWSWNTRRS